MRLTWGGADMARAYKPTHVQRMRAGAASKQAQGADAGAQWLHAVRSGILPVRRVTGGAR